MDADGVGQLQQPDQVGDRRAIDLQPAGQFLLGHSVALQVLLEGEGLFQCVQVLALQVLDDRDFAHLPAKPLGFEYTGYDSSNAETQSANSSEINYQPTGYSKQVFDASKKIFPNTSNTLYTNPLDEGSSRSHLIDRVTTQMQSMAASLVTATGDSDETGLRVGDVVIINESGFSMTGNPKDGVKEQNYGSYIITSISHTCEEGGQYKNRFILKRVMYVESP